MRTKRTQRGETQDNWILTVEKKIQEEYIEQSKLSPLNAVNASLQTNGAKVIDKMRELLPKGIIPSQREVKSAK